MSLSLSQVQETEFDSLVKMIFQSTGFKLKDCVYTKSNIVGKTCQFRKMNQITANLAAFQESIPIQDPTFAPVNATLEKYCAGSLVDEVQDLTNNFDAKRENARCSAVAVGRRSDQIIISAINGSAGSTIANGGTNMSYAKLREVVEKFEDVGVPADERYIAMSANNMRALLASDQIISNLYSPNMAAYNGDLDKKEVLGIQIRIIPAMDEGGLPKAGNIRECYAWHKSAVGMAVGQDLRTEINYLARLTSWFVNSILFAGAVVIDDTGVFQIDCDESVNP